MTDRSSNPPPSAWASQAEAADSASVERLIRRIRDNSRFFAVALGVGITLVAAVNARRHFAATRTSSAASVAYPPSVRLLDGTTGSPLSPGSAVYLKDQAADHVRVELERGSATFEVTPHPERDFCVEVGDVTVEVIGPFTTTASFRVERRKQTARIFVDYGRVRVFWPDGITELYAGASGEYPPP